MLVKFDDVVYIHCNFMVSVVAVDNLRKVAMEHCRSLSYGTVFAAVDYEIKQISYIILLVKFFKKLNFKCKKIKDLTMIKQLTHS